MNKADNNTVMLAEKLFVNDGMTCTEIADKVGRNRRTIESWKKKFGWEEKRAGLIESCRALPQRIYELWNKVATQIEKDINEGKEVSPARYRLASQLFDQIPKAEAVEKAAVAKSETKKMSAKEIIDIVKKAHGVEDDTSV